MLEEIRLSRVEIGSMLRSIQDALAASLGLTSYCCSRPMRACQCQRLVRWASAWKTSRMLEMRLVSSDGHGKPYESTDRLDIRGNVNLLYSPSLPRSPSARFDPPRDVQPPRMRMVRRRSSLLGALFFSAAIRFLAGRLPRADSACSHC